MNHFSQTFPTRHSDKLIPGEKRKDYTTYVRQNIVLAELQGLIRLLFSANCSKYNIELSSIAQDVLWNYTTQYTCITGAAA